MKAMNDSGPKISIITATYNSKQYLRDTIKSILLQKYKKIQYIVIDGGSTDGTLDILQQYRSSIDVLVSESDNGVYEAFNKGINFAKGEVIYFLNSDDFLLDDRVLETVATMFQENPDALGVYGKIAYRQENLDLWEPVHAGAIGEAELQRGLLPPHPAFFARREVYERIGYFDLSYKIASDTDFMLRCFREYPHGFTFVDRWVAAHRRGGASTNLKGYDLVRKERSAIMKKYLGISLPQSTDEVKLNAYYRTWMEQLLFGRGGASKGLFSKGIRQIAIIGANRMGLYLYKDAQLNGITTVALLDNNPPLVGRKMCEIPVYPLSWIETNCLSVDAILVAYDSAMDNPNFQRLAACVRGCGRYFLNWRDVVEMSEEN